MALPVGASVERVSLPNLVARWVEYLPFTVVVCSPRPYETRYVHPGIIRSEGMAKPKGIVGAVRLWSVDFWLVILGAVVGALASFGGSVFINRREAVRAHRLRLLDELIPELLDLTDDGEWAGETQVIGVIMDEPRHWLSVLDRARRLAAITGKREAAYVDRLIEITKERAKIAKDYGGVGLTGVATLVRLSNDATAIARDDELVHRFHDVSKEFETHLIEKVL